VRAGEPKTNLGEFFVFGFEGKTLDRETRHLFSTFRPGGVILFKRNLQDPEQVLRLTREIQATNPASPPLVTIDQEGGRVWRLPPPFTRFPETELLGRAGLESLAYAAARVMGLELAAAGVHCNLAPVLDLNTNPANPVIGDRALGADPRESARLAAAMLRGFRDHGIAGCGKHFPGHGDTHADSHHTLPVVGQDRETLWAREIAPYRILIQGTPHLLEMIMTAHLLVPALDPESPATLSRPILEGLLRRQLAFPGVIITDDLEMKAVSERFSLSEAAPLAFRAGADLLLCCHTPDALPLCVDALERSLQRGHISGRRLLRSRARIRDFRTRLFRRFPPPSVRQALFRRIGCPQHQQVALEVLSHRHPSP